MAVLPKYILMTDLLRVIVFCLVATTAKADSIISNSSFETGNGQGADQWNCSLSVPPVRSEAEAHSGKFSMRSTLKNAGAVPSEGHLSQSVNSGIVEGKTYDLTFWAKQTDFGVSYVQEYMVEWHDDNGARLPGKGLTNFKGQKDWAKVFVPDLVAPVGATGVRLMFRFVTGAVKGGSGEIFIDDVAIKRSDYTEEYNKFLKANPAVAKAIKGGKISKEKVLAGIRSREEEKSADNKTLK